MEHTVIITKKPERSGNQSIPDGALAGNGDVSVILGSCENGLRAYIAKCDLWSADEHRDSNGGIKPLGYVDFEIPQELYNNYYVEQRMDTGELFCRFAIDKRFVELNIFVSAVSNNVIFETKASGNNLISEPKFTMFDCGADKIENEIISDLNIITRTFDNQRLVFPCIVSAGIKEFPTGKYVLSVSTNFDSDTYKNDVVKALSEFNLERLMVEKKKHLQWWKNFYSKSEFKLSNKQLELNWYACQYHLAICARNINFPPGIYGNFITTESVNWHGDYHLNYNYEAPFYAVFSSNHCELSDCYFAPLEDFMERGRECAENYLGCKGIYYPVGMMPKGLFSEYCDNPDLYEKMFLGQKSNASYAAIIMVMRWNSTRDNAFASKHIYPYLKAVGEFWEDYLVYENGRYVIYKDAIHEVSYYIDNFKPYQYKKFINAKNSLLSLGLVRMVFATLLDISRALGVDEDKREKWQDIVEYISDYPTFYKRFKKVFRYTEKGMSWNNGNFLCLQHIYPVGQGDFVKNPEMLKIARNTFSVNNRWFDDNATNSVFPCAVRLGIDAPQIIKNLKLNYKKFQLPNLLMLHGGGCLENCSLTASTLNEMALQSYNGVIRIFPNWDNSISCSYKNLRADGAFLVSADITNGVISNVSITAEQGGKAVLQNPFEKCILSNDKNNIYTEKLLEINFEKNESISIIKA